MDKQRPDRVFTAPCSSFLAFAPPLLVLPAFRRSLGWLITPASFLDSVQQSLSPWVGRLPNLSRVSWCVCSLLRGFRLRTSVNQEGKEVREIDIWSRLGSRRRRLGPFVRKMATEWLRSVRVLTDAYPGSWAARPGTPRPSAAGALSCQRPISSPTKPPGPWRIKFAHRVLRRRPKQAEAEPPRTAPFSS